jgi:hypothetical protein
MSSEVDLSEHFRYNNIVIETLAHMAESADSSIEGMPCSIEDLLQLATLLEELPLLPPIVERCHDEEGNELFFVPSFHLRLTFLPKENRENILVYFPYPRTETRSYVFPLGMALNLALDALRGCYGRLVFPWEEEPKNHSEKDAVGIASIVDSVNFDLGTSNQQYKDEIGQAAWDVERVSAIAKLIEHLIKSKEPVSRLLIERYLDTALYEIEERKSKLEDIGLAFGGLQKGWLSSDEDEVVTCLAHIIRFTLRSFSLMKNSSVIRYCPLCGRLFFPSKRADQKYCDYGYNPTYAGESCAQAAQKIKSRLVRNKQTIRNRITKRFQLEEEYSDRKQDCRLFEREDYRVTKKIESNDPKKGKGQAVETHLKTLFFLCFQEVDPRFESNTERKKPKTNITKNKLYDLALKNYLDVTEWFKAPYSTKVNSTITEPVLSNWRGRE